MNFYRLRLSRACGRMAATLACLLVLLPLCPLVAASSVDADSSETSDEAEDTAASNASGAAADANSKPSEAAAAGAGEPAASVVTPASTASVVPPAVPSSAPTVSPAAPQASSGSPAVPPRAAKSDAAPKSSEAIKPSVKVTGMKTLRNVFYAGTRNPFQTMDIFLPEGVKSTTPVVVWIHGGSWWGGSKEDCPATFMVSAGFATVSINYRLSQEAPFPAQLVDCKSVIRYLREHAKELNIDPTRIGVWGASAGGHLAALLGTTGDDDPFAPKGQKAKVSYGVQAVCDWCGPTDFRDMLRKLASKEVTVGQVQPIISLLGNKCTPEWLAASSPVSYATEKAPPFLIMHGDADGTVPVAQSRYLHSVLKTRKVDSTLVVLKGEGHSLASSANARLVLEFFKRTLRQG